MGVGGIASFSKNVSKAWSRREPEMILWEVPRNDFLGWIIYWPKLVYFAVYSLLLRPQLIHVNLASKGSPLRKAPYVLVAKLLRMSVFSQIHSGVFDQEVLSRSPKSIWRRVALAILSASEKTIFINQRQMANMVSHQLVSASKAVFLANHVGIPEKIIELESMQNFDAVFVGRVSIAKGAADLLESLKMLQSHSLSLALVGRIELEGFEVGSPVKINGHSVSFLGEVSHSDAMQVINSSRILVLPSHSENFPMVLLEAFARCKPVIATPVGEIENIIRKSQGGSLVAVGDIENLSKKIDEYFNAPEKILEAGSLGRKYVEEHCDIRNYQSKLMSIYFSEDESRGDVTLKDAK